MLSHRGVRQLPLVGLLVLHVLSFPIKGFVIPTKQHSTFRFGFDESILIDRFLQQRRYNTELSARGSWERLETEEDPKPKWYLINCMAGNELVLLQQIKENCNGMPDVHKVVVPMVTKTRSHGPNRIVTEKKTKVQGYVFAKLRLCKEVYEAIQSLDFCRSWMGTANKKGLKRLPPRPFPMEPDEVEQLGLDELEEGLEFDEVFDEDLTTVNGTSVIVDTEERDRRDDEIENSRVDQEALKVYRGLKVDDMIKVTAKNQFQNEDGIVKRLKDDKIFVRFYTYGTLFEQWLDPTDVRKLSSEEILRGLSGPSQPISDRTNQHQEERNRGGGNNQGNFMRHVKGFNGGRMRREDRRFEQLKRHGIDNEPRNQGQNRSGRSQDNNNFRRNDVGWDFDSDSQRRGRDTRRKPRNEQANRRSRNAVDGDDDWSSFVSSSGSKSTGRAPEGDDFLNSLMKDLNKDLQTKPPSGNKNRRKKPENDFFETLLNDLNDKREGEKEMEPRDSADDDFFTFMENELNAEGKENPDQSKGQSADDDFFSSLQRDLERDQKSTKSSGRSRTNSDKGGGDDAFFGSLQQELEGGDFGSSTEKQKPSATDDSDFFDSLEETFGSFDAVDNIGGDTMSPLNSDASAVGLPKPSTAIEDDDFFASLQRELDDSLGDSEVKSPSTLSGGDDDFFGSFSSNPQQGLSDGFDSLENGKSTEDDQEDDFFGSFAVSKKGQSSDGNEDDFFAKLESELNDELGTASQKSSPTASKSGDDFSASLQAQMDDMQRVVKDNEPAVLEEQKGEHEQRPKAKSTKETKASSAPKATTPSDVVNADEGSSTASNALDSDGLKKLTVPVLKGMLKERGLKVSGKKAELIERLTQ